MAESFVFYKSFFEALMMVSGDECQKFLERICLYAFYDIEPEFAKEELAQRMSFALLRPQLDANERRREIGKLGGRPRKTTEEKPMVSEEKPMVLTSKPMVSNEKPMVLDKKPMVSEEKPMVTNTKPNVNVNVNVNGNENATANGKGNENENDNGDLFKGLPPLPPPGPAEATPLTGEPVKKQDPKITLGKYRHVQLTHREYADLCLEFPDAEARIQRLDDYMEQSGKKYNSHYATIKNWARRDKEKEEAKRKQKIGTFGFSTPDGYGG